jgi:signal transduction histidine kinase
MAPASGPAEAELAPPILAVADAHRGGALAIEVELDGLPPVAAPPAMIQAVIETLVENSRQAGARRVRISGKAAGDQVRLRVEDDGPGIPPADHERIFEPFHTGRRDEGGSGLGLSIARSLLAASAGTIVSRPSADGALFEICLPAAR